MEDNQMTNDAPADSQDETPVAESTDAPAAAEAPKQNRQESPEAKLFVGGISWGTTDEGLRAAFEQFGTVASAEVIRERATGRSKGFGFVVMGSSEEAQAAVDKMNGQMLDGRQVTVNIARPKTESRDNNRGDRDSHRRF